MEEKKCKYCGGELSKVGMPPESKFEAEYLMICLSDECDYYKRGWTWMKSNYNVKASYRYQYNPFTSEEGPFPVARPEDLKDMVIE